MNGFLRYELTIRNKEGKIVCLTSVYTESAIERNKEEWKNCTVEVDTIYKDASEY